MTPTWPRSHWKETTTSFSRSASGACSSGTAGSCPGAPCSFLSWEEIMELYLPATHQSSLGLMSRRVQQLQPSGHTVFPITGMSCFIDGWISTEASMRHSATYYYPNQCPCLGRFMMAVREVLRGKWSPFWTAGEGDSLWISRWANKQLCFGIKVGCVCEYLYCR